MQTYGLNLSGAYNAFRDSYRDARERRDTQQKENKLADLATEKRFYTGQAIQGDQNAFKRLLGLDPQAGMAVKQYTDAQRKADTEEFLSAAYGAKTPEAWAQVVDRFKAKGHQFDPGESDFSNRENLIREGMSVAEQYGLDFKEKNFAADEAYRGATLGISREELAIKKAAAANEAPELVSLYDEKTGQPYKARYNPQTKSFDRVAGVKAATGQGGSGVTTKMKNDAVGVDQAYRNLDAALADYENLIGETGVSMVSGPQNDKIVQARTNLQLQLKELYNLGVLNGPDLSLMQQMIFDPQASVFNPLGAAVKIAGSLDPTGTIPSVSDRAKSSIGQLRGMLKTIRNNKTRGILDEQGNFSGAANQPQQSDQFEIPIDAVHELVADPSSAEEFDEIFGEGAAASVLEGQ